MIRFATQPSETIADRQVRAQKLAAPGGNAGGDAKLAPSATMLLPELAEGNGEAAAPAGKPRGARKQKTKAAVGEADVQLDLNA